MIFSEKDEVFKSLYLDAIDKELEESPTNYEFHDFVGLLFDNKLILDVYANEPQITKEDLNLLDHDDQVIGYFVFTDKSKSASEVSTCTADEILYIWNNYRKHGVYMDRFLCDFLVIKKDFFNNYYWLCCTKI